MRISQTLANQIALKMVKEKRSIQSELQVKYREYFTGVAEKKVPKDVMEFFKKHSEYVKTTSSMRVDGKGFNRLDVHLTRAIPSVSPNCYYEHVDLTETEAEKGKKLHQEWLKMKDNNDALEVEIETALINLRTYANVQKELPEAAIHLPEQGLTVIVNTADLRKKLK